MPNIYEQIVAATVDGDEQRCIELANEALNLGLNASDVLQNGYAHGMQIVGDKFARLDIFLPEVILAADAMNAAIAVLKPHLLKSDPKPASGTIVIATIQGDLHDLGKNIVSIMLRAAGFTVYDLGADIPVRNLLDKAEEVNADIIAASAILTTTMAHMPDIDKILVEMGIREKYMIMLGGAPVIRQWAMEAGADGYGENATEAVETAKQLMQTKNADQKASIS